MELDGLKEKNSVGEKIDFILRVEGFDHLCGTPTFRIVNDKDVEKVASDWNSVNLIVCDPDMRDINETWTVQQMGVQGEIALLETGSYKAIAEYGNRITEKEFQVISGEPTVSWDTPGTTLCESSLCCHRLEHNSVTYFINFRFNGTIQSMTFDPTRTLTITLKARSDGNLEIAVPRELVNPSDGTQDVDSAVFADDLNVAANEYSTNDTKWAEALGISEHPEKYRILDIPIWAGSKTVVITVVTFA